MRSRLFLCLALVSLFSSPAVRSQSGIAPLPELERLSPPGLLKVTLNISASRLQPGDTPLFSLRMENTGSTALRFPADIYVRGNVERRVFSAAGEEIQWFSLCDAFSDHRTVMPIRVRDLKTLAAGQSTVISVQNVCFEPPLLPVGEYQFRLKYRNYPDFPYLYDVYEDGGTETWAGEFEAPPVRSSSNHSTMIRVGG